MAFTNYSDPKLRDPQDTGARPNLVCENVLDLMGNTPMVALKKLFGSFPLNVYGKLEGCNPSGSAKDRPALNLLLDGIQRGLVDRDTTIIESSSGNLAIGLSQACRYLGLELICVVDAKTTTQNLKMIAAYGTRVDVVADPDPTTGEFLPARLNRVRELCDQNPNSFWPNQYGNPANSASHYKTTMKEIASVFNDKVDYLFVAVSTCGTLRGCAEYIRDHKLPTKVMAVDAQGSVIFGNLPQTRLLPGHGAGIVPDNYQDGLADEVVHVSDLECVLGCRRLLYQEAIMAGASSGGCITAALKYAPEMKPGSTCVAILADRGERYLDTVYSDEWVERHFGTVPELDMSTYEEKDREASGSLQVTSTALSMTIEL
jgi:N-(2-amino-2-carboxyethyl)-L-glutamate synthase